jgi:hypothetical protein
MKIIIEWIGQNVASSIAILISLVSLVITAVLNQKEGPNIMPNGEDVTNGNHLSLKFLNTSQFNIHNVTILINVFDSQLNEVNTVHISDKYLFSIGEKTTFHYGWILGEYAGNNFYLRIRFSGYYNSRFPIFPKRKFSQSIWYSAVPIGRIDENKLTVKISTTHKDDIEKIEAKHAISLKNYEKTIDKKFSSS